MNIPTALGPTFRGTRNRGFTIVELLVSLALIIFIMSLVSTIFVLATKSFRDMKAAGDLSEQLRSAGQLVRAMIKANHFEGNTQPSDVDFWKPLNSSNPLSPPYLDKDLKDPSGYNWRQGYFRFEQSDASSVEGADFDNINVNKADGLADHRLSMSVLLNGNSPSDVFSAYYDPSSTPPAPRPTFLANPNYSFFENSSLVRRPKAEVAFFLAGPDLLDAPMTGLLSGNSSLKLYSLHMKTWLLKDSGDPVGTVAAGSNSDINLSYPSLTGPTTWSDLGNVSNPIQRASTQFFTNNPTSTRTASSLQPQTLILRNVISFEVQLLDRSGALVQIRGKPTTANTTNNFYYFDTSAEANWNKVVSTNMGVTTTSYNQIPGAWAAANWMQSTGVSTPAPIISAIKIRIRVYDPDNEITRQMTIIEPL